MSPLSLSLLGFGTRSIVSRSWKSEGAESHKRVETNVGGASREEEVRTAERNGHMNKIGTKLGRLDGETMLF